MATRLGAGPRPTPTPVGSSDEPVHPQRRAAAGQRRGPRPSDRPDLPAIDPGAAAAGRPGRRPRPRLTRLGSNEGAGASMTSAMSAYWGPKRIVPRDDAEFGVQ